MKNVILVGSSGHAKVIIDILEQEKKYKIVGIFDRSENIGKEIYGYPIIGEEKNIAKFIEECQIEGGIIGIGDNYIRKKVSEIITSVIPNFQFINAIHPSAQIGKNVTMGKGNVLIAGSVVNADAVVGNHCILNTNSSLGHEGIMKDYSSLSSNATIGGGAVIGECSVVALSATVLHSRKIGEHTIIGSGAVVVQDIPSYVVALGTPAKIVKKRNPGDKYY